MTLIVSLRIPDGIVLAGDSLATMMHQLEIQGTVNVTCPNCQHVHDVGPIKVGNVSLPATTYSFAQKVFPFLNEYGVGTFNLGQLHGKTIYYIMRELEKELSPNIADYSGCVSKVAEIIRDHLVKLVRSQFTDIDQTADDFYALGTQVVGYDGPEAKTIVNHIGKSLRTESFIGPGCTLSGQGYVVNALWELSKKQPDEQPQFKHFSLQDAISYVEFLIGTTAAYQKFSMRIPAVGGDIDIALITPFDHFKWIKMKPLTRSNGGGNGHWT